MSNMDHTMGPVIIQDNSEPVQSPRQSTKLCIGACSDVKQTEAVNARGSCGNGKIEGSRASQGENLASTPSRELSHKGRSFPASAAPATEFTLFRKLPAELQLMIWEAALPGPRVVDLNFQFEDHKFAFGSQLEFCNSPTPPPVILSVCHESRIVALKRYALCFAMRSEDVGVYCDLEIDTIFISGCYPADDILVCLHCASPFYDPVFQGIRHIAVGLHPEMPHIRPGEYIFLMEQLTGLETFAFVLHEKHDCGIVANFGHVPEADGEKELKLYGERFAEAVVDKSRWMPGRWRKAPALKLMTANELYENIPISESAHGLYGRCLSRKIQHGKWRFTPPDVPDHLVYVKKRSSKVKNPAT